MGILNKAKTATMATLFGATLNSATPVQADNVNVQNKTEQTVNPQKNEISDNAKKYTKNVTLRNDSVAMVSGVQGYYNQNSDEIFIRKGDMKISDFTDKMHNTDENEELILVHEDTHRISVSKGCGRTPMSLSEYYMEGMHSEIVSSMAEKLEIRRQYKDAKTQNDKNAVLQKFAHDEKNAEYVNAIKAKQINPDSKNRTDFIKEMGFIKDSSTKYWNNNDAGGYVESQIKN